MGIIHESCGPVSGCTVAEACIRDLDDRTVKYYSLTEVEGIPNFFETDESTYDRQIEEVDDEEFWDMLSVHTVSFQKGCYSEMLEEKIRELYRITAELEEKYPGRRFTPDGHLVGSIGEVYAAEKYGLILLETSSEKHDALSADGRLIQIKITQTDRVSIYSEPDYLIVMKMEKDGTIGEVYNGKGAAPWERAGKVRKNGQRSISLSKLVSLNATVSFEDRIRKME